MAFSSLRDFIDRLEKEGRLVRVGEPVSPNLEMTEIHLLENFCIVLSMLYSSI